MKPKRTILCVDDNEQSLSIRKVLLETRGYRVVTCTTGEEAIERFRKGGIDLVLTDLVMPGVDGSKVVAEVKAMSPDTPAILLSGKVRIYDRDTHADVFLPKGHVCACGVAGTHPASPHSQARAKTIAASAICVRQPKRMLPRRAVREGPFL